MLEFDTTDNKFRDELLTDPLGVQDQVKENKWYIKIREDPGIGFNLDLDFIEKYEINY